MTRLAWMQIFPSDHIAATRHLTLAQRGALFDLLCMAWTIGPLPDDPARLAAMVGASAKEWKTVWPAISGWWTPTAAGLVSAPLESRRVHAAQVYEARAEAGRESARKRRGQRDGHRIGQRDGSRIGQREETTTTTTGKSKRLTKGKASPLNGADGGKNDG